MGNLPVQFQKDFAGGMVTNINENLAPQNSVRLGLNGVFDEEIGSFVTRLGSAIVNAQVESGKTCLGLHNFRDADGSNHRLIVFFNNAGDTQAVGYNVETGATITGLTTQTANLKHRMITFLDSTLIVNGTDAPASYDGTTVIVTAGAFDLANIPFAEPSHVIEWLDRVYLFGDAANPDRLYYSGSADGGAISWTVGNGYVDIEPEDGGGGLTAVGKVPGFLLIFKERSMKRWNFDSAFPETLVDIGTPSQESVINAGSACAFYSASSDDTHGFYVTNGGDPVLISHDRAKGIKKWVDAIPQANEADVAGFGTRRYFMWAIGDVTVDGKAYTNVVVRWNKTLDQWSVFSFPGEFKFFSSFVDGGVNKVVAGDDDGNVVELNKDDTFTDYDGSLIRYQVDIQDEKFGYNQVKEMSERLVVESIGMEGADVELTDDTDKKFVSGKIDGRVTELPLPDSVQANVFKVSIAGEVNGRRAILKEIEYPNVNVLQNYGN